MGTVGWQSEPLMVHLLSACGCGTLSQPLGREDESGCGQTSDKRRARCATLNG